MIKFFRKIRQKLLQENRFSKYLLYAVGEIALIVIGIMIALQLNNWNEKNNNEILLNENLKILIRDIQNDLLDIKRVKKHYAKLKPLFISIITDSITHEEFINYNRSNMLTYFPDWTIEQKGILLMTGNNIKNDSLINNIIDTYNHYSKLIIDSEIRLTDNNYENMTYYRNNFDWFALWCLPSRGVMIEAEIINESLYNNKEYKKRTGQRYLMLYDNYLKYIIEFEIELIEYLKLIKLRVN